MFEQKYSRTNNSDIELVQRLFIGIGHTFLSFKREHDNTFLMCTVLVMATLAILYCDKLQQGSSII